MGIERCTAWIAGLPHVRETIAFPRLYEWVRP
jgi:asparaginyl-tRNA synthetase